MTKIVVEGMRCEGCVRRIAGALKELGVQAEISLKEGTVTVETENAGILAQIKEEIEDLGFEVN